MDAKLNFIHAREHLIFCDLFAERPVDVFRFGWCQRPPDQLYEQRAGTTRVMTVVGLSIAISSPSTGTPISGVRARW